MPRPLHTPAASTRVPQPGIPPVASRFQRLLQRAAVVVLGIVFGMLSSFLLLGVLAPVTFSQTTTLLVPASRTEIWQLWQEDSGVPVALGEWGRRLQQEKKAVFDVVEVIPYRSQVVRMTSSSFGMVGRWVFTLEDAGATTAVTIREESSVTSPISRALLTLAGRDRYLHSERLRLLQKFSSGKQE